MFGIKYCAYLERLLLEKNKKNNLTLRFSIFFGGGCVMNRIVNIVRRYAFLGLISFFFLGELKAQDPEFSQFYANYLHLNPAMAGVFRCPRVVLSYRDQWPGLTGTFTTGMASYDQYVNSLHGGVGIYLMNDQQGEGTLNTNTVNAMYAFHLDVNRDFALRFGLQGTFYQKSLDRTKLVFGDQIDTRMGKIYDTQEILANFDGTTFFDFSTGIVGYGSNYYLGAAVHHLAEPDETVVRGESLMPRKYTFHAGMVFSQGGQRGGIYGAGGSSTFSPNVMYRIQGDFDQLNIGAYWEKAPIVFGVWYRNSRNPDSIIGLIGIKKDAFRLGYTVDITVSSLGVPNTYGAHELSLGLQFPCKKKKRKYRTISCPDF